jgi:uncharacterized membrane protein YeaQ/YmgE (transglycosylase-associated protein family)
MALIGFLLIGGIAGWIAGKLIKGEGYGLLADIAIGVIGGLIGGWLFGEIGITAGSLVGSIVTAIIGAIILIVGLRAVQRAL